MTVQLQDCIFNLELTNTLSCRYTWFMKHYKSYLDEDCIWFTDGGDDDHALHTIIIFIIIGKT